MVETCDCPVGLFLPLFGGWEQDWPRGLRIALYLAGLLWLFMGVAIVADIFMGAIEKVTSAKRRVINRQTNRYVTVRVWNETVANLTLMALGSSAPEILLSVIELTLLPPTMMSGDLGPSTIVGSAAFNLLIITAVCVMSIPSGEVRYIKETGVFFITASFSLFAYFWLLVIVQYSSPNVIEIWESALTLLFFPLLIVLAFLADIGYFENLFGAIAGKPKTLSELSEEDLAALETKFQNQHGGNLTQNQLIKLIEKENPKNKTRACYRIGATRALTGSKRVSSLGKVRQSLSSILPMVADADNPDRKESAIVADVHVGFVSASYAVLESVGSLDLLVMRYGAVDCILRVDYSTRDGTAVANSDYQPVQGTLEFAPGEVQKSLSIKIIDDTAYEDDEEFFVDLSNPQATAEDTIIADLNDNGTARIQIIDDDEPGTFGFNTEKDTDELKVQEGLESKSYTIGVKRINGSNGTVTMKYCTEDSTAHKDTDFQECEGTLTFLPGQLVATFELNILPRGRYESTEMFRVMLTDITAGGRFDPKRDGGADCQILTVIIVPDERAKSRIDTLMNVLRVDLDQQYLAHANWRDQFRSAVQVNGGAEYSITDLVMHILTVFWKVVFAAIPPTEFSGGWVCFIVALGMIGVVTALIGDLASLLGCVIGMQDSTTAITLVALGTSLPDTFASKVAAEQDQYADASIGNVTGSNSVNVFLGLGLPWFIGALYWAAVGRTQEWQDMYRDEDGKKGTRKYFDEWNQGGGKFVVVGEDLKNSVTVFVATALVCLALIVFRRRAFGGELGGPLIPKILSAVVMLGLWICYIVLSIANTAPVPGYCA